MNGIEVDRFLGLLEMLRAGGEAMFETGMFEQLMAVDNGLTDAPIDGWHDVVHKPGPPR